MPFDLGHDPKFLAPRLGLIAETGVETADMVGRTADGSRPQMGGVFQEDLVDFEADGVFVTFGFQEFVEVRQGKGSIPSEIAARVPFPVALDDRPQNVAPAVGAVDVAGAQGAPFQIAELVE